MSPRESAPFLFAVAAYPKSPLQGKWAMLHGKLVAQTNNGNENQFIVEDSKGTWEGYSYAQSIPLEEGSNVRAYGQLKPQPDGRCKVALQWIKSIPENEYQFIQTQTQKNWEKLVEQFPQLPMLQPFEGKPILVQQRSAPKPAAPQQEEFIPANELKVEQDYV